MEADEVLFHLNILSKSEGYQLALHAVNLLLLCENWTPSLKALQQEVAKTHYCTYETFKQNIGRVIQNTWENENLRARLNEIAFITLANKPTVRQFIDIVYNYVARSREAVGVSSNPAAHRPPTAAPSD